MENDVEFIKNRYAKARNKYKPNSIRVLLIAEAPPNNLDRYFYFEEVKTQDSLFLEIMGVLYPEQKQVYLSSGRDAHLKAGLLETFKEDGYHLIDLSQVPGSLSGASYESCVPPLLEGLNKLIDKKTPVLLIKANVYDICFAPLVTNGYAVYNSRMPFPGSGQQRVFREKFKKAIAAL